MKAANQLGFKVLAVSIAVGLGGGYVWKRQQSAATPPAQPSVEAKEEEAKEKPPTLLLSGSKSGAVNLEDTGTVQLRKPLMPGSKSTILIEPQKEPQPEPPEPKKP